jgi:diguanylate cyclase (GGDEF)-like protein
MTAAAPSSFDPAMPPPASQVQALPPRDAAMDRRMHVAVIGFYLLDALFLGGYAALGLVPPHVPPLFALLGLVVGGSCLATMHTAWFVRHQDSWVILAQTVIAGAAVLAVARAAPAVAGLMLITLVVIFPTAALRMPLGLTLGLAAVASVAAIALALHVKAGHGLGLPVATATQQALSAAFIFYTLAKGAGVNLVGAAWRRQLADSQEQLAQALARVEALATRDELTGLPNRRHVLDLLTREILRCQRTAQDFAVVMVDIDHFKQVNDTHGHAVGDAVLRAFAAIAQGALRAHDSVGRLGGEEFLLLLPGPIDAEGAQAVAERLRERAQGHDWAAAASGVAITVSSGATLHRRGDSAQSLLERADRLLYEAKHGGRNRVQLG